MYIYTQHTHTYIPTNKQLKEGSNLKDITGWHLSECAGRQKKRNWCNYIIISPNRINTSKLRWFFDTKFGQIMTYILVKSLAHVSLGLLTVYNVYWCFWNCFYNLLLCDFSVLTSITIHLHLVGQEQQTKNIILFGSCLNLWGFEVSYRSMGDGLLAGMCTTEGNGVIDKPSFASVIIQDRLSLGLLEWLRISDGWRLLFSSNSY